LLGADHWKSVTVEQAHLDEHRGLIPEGAEWIDDLAIQARRRLRAPRDERVIGHFDWRVENLAFRGSEITAIYGWDSIAADTEAVLVGNTAALFTADWTVGILGPVIVPHLG
jgi:hypothetical protein